jgi:hypothetical protein
VRYGGAGPEKGEAGKAISLGLGFVDLLVSMGRRLSRDLSFHPDG